MTPTSVTSAGPALRIQTSPFIERAPWQFDGDIGTLVEFVLAGLLVAPALLDFGHRVARSGLLIGEDERHQSHEQR